MNTLEILREARAWLGADPKRWTQGTYWRDKAGSAVTSFDDVACTCPLGAVAFMMGPHGPRDDLEGTNPNRLKDATFEAISAFDALEEAVLGFNPNGSGDVGEWNDKPRRTHKQVLALFDRAIAKLEARA